MIATLLAMVAALAIGCLLAYRFGGLRDLAPRWAAWLLIAGCGTAAGVGLISIVFLLCRMLVPGMPLLPRLVEAALAVWLGIEVWRTRREPAPAAAVKSLSWNPALAAVLLITLAIGTAAMSDFWEANPQGNWDAWAIWNLRARFLDAPGHLPSRAWSPQLTGSHPEYPLLLSGFIASSWNDAGSINALAPIAAGYALFLALIAICTGGLAALRSGSLGLMLGLALAGSPFLLHEVPSQYSDIPLACYFAGAVVLMLLGRSLGAGVLASMAAWTKNEGLLFLALLLAALLIFRRREFLRALAGAAPVTALALIFKFFIARGTASPLAQTAGGFLSKLIDPHRYATVLGEVLPGLWNLGSGWYHPLWPVLALCVLLRLRREGRREVVPAAAVTCAMLLGYLGVYVIAPADVNWQVGTTLDRLAAQFWPILLICIFAWLRAPEDWSKAATAPAPAAPARATRKRR